MPTTVNGTTITYPDNTTQTTTSNYQATDGSASYTGYTNYVVGTYMLMNVYTFGQPYSSSYVPPIDTNGIGTSYFGSFSSATNALPSLYSGDPTQMARTFGQGYVVSGTNPSTVSGYSANFAVWSGVWRNRGSNPIQMLIQRVA